jgi:thiosulfate dehydrogenase [quinone] large subunit
MSKISAPLPKTIAAMRIATSVFFLFFGEYKVFGSGFAHGGFQKYLQGYIDGEAVAFYKPVLVHLIWPHAVFFGYLVGVWELFIGISLLVGIWVRSASIAGIILMLNLTLATWFGPGHDAPTWHYFGNELDHLPLLFLFVIFFVSNGGEVWGLDKKRGY